MTRVERFHRARRDRDLAVLEGFHAIKHALRFGAELLEIVLAENGDALRLGTDLAPDTLASLQRAEEVADTEYARLAPLPHPTGVIALARRREATPAAALGGHSAAPLVLLEAPVHAGNVGAAVRVAAAAGASGLLSTGVIDPWQPEALRAAAGLHYALPVARLDNLEFGDRPLVALAPAGEILGKEPLPAGAVLAFGTERAGLSSELLDRADKRLSIPMTDGISSLNLATAVAVVLYAWKLAQPPAKRDS